MTDDQPPNPPVRLYDTTLRDGTQAEGVSFSMTDKVRIARRLNAFGVAYIEGGWPGSNPTDMAFFEEMRGEPLSHAKIAAFGSTRRAQFTPEDDPNLRTLLQAETPVTTIFGKTWLLHVHDVLRVAPEVNLDMISSSCQFLRDNGKEVIFDAEHFFDGYKANPDYAMKTLAAAAEAFARAVKLNPAYVDARYNLALVNHYHLGRTPQALRDLETVLSQKPDYQPAIDLIARIRK